MRKLLICASAPALMLAAALPAAAQAVDESQVNEVIVTAQKRAENVQDVPLAVAVVTGAQLENAGVRDFGELTRISPSLTIIPSDNPANASVAIRGIGTFAFSIGVEPSVAVQVDDVPVAFQARAFSDLTDIARVEVLRGPQSTLYGKSASAGLINITTKDPTPELSATVNLLATSDDEYRGSISLAGPINDKIGFRLAASHGDFKGNVRNIFDGKTVNGRTETNLRGKLVWEASEKLKVTLGANYTDGSASATTVYHEIGPNSLLRNTPGVTAAVALPGITPSRTNLAIAWDTPPASSWDGFGQSLKLEYDLPGDFTLLSITANDQFRLDDQIDIDRSAYAPLQNRSIGTYKAKVRTQEFRLLSPDSDTFRYTLGVFWGDNDLTRTFERGPRFSLAKWYGTSTSESKAAFGQADLTLLPKTTATVGARIQREEIGYTFNDILAGANFAGGAKDSSSTYRLGLRHEVTNDIMLFGSYATGHKGQTYDLTTGFNTTRASAGPVQPETSKSWEVGLKTQFFARRLTLNLTAFDVAYEDFQAQGVELIGGVQNFYLTNVGRAKTRGVELEAFATPIRNLQLNWAVAYLDGSITEFLGASCYPGQTAAQGCTGSPGRQDLSGADLPNAPRWKTNLGWDYRHALQNAPFDLTLTGSATWQSKVNFSLSQDPQTRRGDYGIVNLAAGVRERDGRYQVTAFVNNLFDKQYAVALGNQAGNWGNRLANTFQPARDFERYYGVRLQFNY